MRSRAAGRRCANQQGEAQQHRRFIRRNCSIPAASGNSDKRETPVKPVSTPIVDIWLLRSSPTHGGEPPDVLFAAMATAQAPGQTVNTSTQAAIHPRCIPLGVASELVVGHLAERGRF